MCGISKYGGFLRHCLWLFLLLASWESYMATGHFTISCFNSTHNDSDLGTAEWQDGKHLRPRWPHGAGPSHRCGPFSSVAQLCPTLRPHESQHARPPCPSPTPGVYSNSIKSVMPSSRLILCHPLLLLPPVPPRSGSFPMSQFFPSGGQSTGVSASASVLPMNTQDWSPLGWSGWISLQSKGLSRVFSNTTVQKHQFFDAQLSSQSNSHIHTWPLEKP